MSKIAIISPKLTTAEKELFLSLFQKAGIEKPFISFVETIFTADTVCTETMKEEPDIVIVYASPLAMAKHYQKKITMAAETKEKVPPKKFIGYRLLYGNGEDSGAIVTCSKEQELLNILAKSKAEVV